MNIQTIKYIGARFLVLSLLVLPVFIQAQVPDQPSGSVPISATIKNPFKGGDDLMSLITTILNDIVMPIAAVGIVMWIVWAGFQFVLAQGNPGAIEKAKQNLLWSLIGGGILLGAVAISKAIEATVDALITT